MPTTCRRCGRPTRTVALEDRKGRRVGELALDPEPHPNGDVLVGHGAGAQLRGPALDAAHRGRLELYRLHLAACPDTAGIEPQPADGGTDQEGDPWARRRDLDL